MRNIITHFLYESDVITERPLWKNDSGDFELYQVVVESEDDHEGEEEGGRRQEVPYVVVIVEVEQFAFLEKKMSHKFSISICVNQIKFQKLMHYFMQPMSKYSVLPKTI